MSEPTSVVNDEGAMRTMVETKRRKLNNIEVSPMKAKASNDIEERMKESQSLNMLHGELRSVTDPVHGFVELPGVIWKIIDTPEFQRLRGLKQLGASYLIYPGAQHRRFEHSIGVSFLGMQWVKMIRARQPELNITDLDVLCVGIAGLCHDLGHGPFSHVFDELLKHEYPESNWSHERGSGMILDRIKAKHPSLASQLSTQDWLFIKELILGKKIEGGVDYRKGRPRNKYFLYQLINNERSGLDVDKLDYMLRDSYFCGVTGVKGSTIQRLMNLARVYPTEDDPDTKLICFPEKAVQPVFFDVFQLRMRLHNVVYQMPKTKACELMVADILKLASKHLRFTNEQGEEFMLLETYKDMDVYCQLEDSVLDLVRYSNDPALKPAKTLLQKMLTRDLYRCCGSVPCPPFLLKESPRVREQLIANKLLSSLNDKAEVNLSQQTETTMSGLSISDYKFTEADFIVDFMYVHHGRGGRNPLDDMLFFKKQSEVARKLDAAKYGVGVLPDTFAIPSIRIFAKQRSHQAVITRAFRFWGKDNRMPSPIYSQDVSRNGDIREPGGLNPIQFVTMEEQARAVEEDAFRQLDHEFEEN